MQQTWNTFTHHVFYSKVFPQNWICHFIINIVWSVFLLSNSLIYHPPSLPNVLLSPFHTSFCVISLRGFTRLPYLTKSVILVRLCEISCQLLSITPVVHLTQLLPKNPSHTCFSATPASYPSCHPYILFVMCIFKYTCLKYLSTTSNFNLLTLLFSTAYI